MYVYHVQQPRLLRHNNINSQSTLQLMPSSVSFVPFSWNKEEGRPRLNKRKLNDTVDKYLADS